MTTLSRTEVRRPFPELLRAFGWLVLAAALVAVLLWLRGQVGAIIGLIPLADRQWVVMQAANQVNPETVGTMLGRVQFLLLAAAGVCAGVSLHTLTLSAWAARHDRIRRALVWLLDHPAVPLILLALVMGVVYTLQRSIIIDGTRYFYLDDDAMISMRYARNWASGFGPVWNPGEWVEGYTNFLWTAIMALVHLIGFKEAITSAVVSGISWGMVAALIVVLGSALRGLGTNRFWTFVLCLALLLDENFVQWNRSGLETTPLALLVTICAWALVRERPTIFAVALALMPLVRSDAFVLAGVFGLCFLWLNRAQPRRAIMLLALAVVPTLLHFLWRYATYGAWLPNTYYLKATGVDSPWRIGLAYSLRLLVAYPLWLLLTFAAPWLNGLNRVGRVLPVVVAVQIAYVIWVGGDTFWFLRPIAPIQPLMVLSAGAVLAGMSAGLRPAWTAGLAAVLLLFAPVAAWGGELFTSPSAEPDLFDGQTQTLGLLIERNTPPGTLISIEPAGTIPYFADQQRFVDALGKSDAHIAHQPAYPGNTLIGHNKFDWDYVYNERQPDIVLASCYQTGNWPNLPPEEQAEVLANRPANDLAYLPAQIINPDFMSLYLPNPIEYMVAPELEANWILCPFSREGRTIEPLWTLDVEPVATLWLDLDQPIHGVGWYPPEVWDDGRTVQHSGPGTTSTFYLPPLTPNASGVLAMCILPVRPEVLNSLELRVNGLPAAPAGGINESCTGTYLALGLPAAGLALQPEAISVTFTVDETYVPDTFLNNNDLRSVGFALDWVRLERVITR